MATTTLRWRDGAIVDEGTPVFSRTCWMDKATAVQQVVSTGAMVENRLVDFPVRTFSRYDRAISVRYHLTIKASLISAKAYQYWENIDKISYQGGDLFSPIPSEMRGNLYNVNNPEELVLGYISASEVAQCDLYYSNIKEKFYRVSEEEKAYLLLQQIADTGGNAWTLFYNGYYPYYAVYGASESVPDYYMWIKNSCLDCESMGGEAKKPAVWDELFDEEL